MNERSSKTDWKRLAAMRDEDIDTGDIPELSDEFFLNAGVRLPVDDQQKFVMRECDISEVE